MDDVDAAHPMPDLYRGSVRETLIERALTASELASRAESELSRGYYLGVSRNARDVLGLIERECDNWCPTERNRR